MALTLMRHTRPDIAPGICYGQLDVDVRRGFEADAAATLKSIPKVSRIYASPLQRAHKLAAYLAKERNLQLSLDARLQEMNFGAWEGKAWDDIARAELDMWAADFLHARPHGGESVAMVRARTLEALTAFRASGEDSLIVTHAGVIKAALATGDQPEDWPSAIDYCATVTLS